MNSIRTFIDKKIKERDIEFFLFVLFFIYMMVVYGIRLFKFAPWYDELYTYYYFISNGPIYSAIHWPVPNNHIGYSVLSGILYEITHNGFVSLRGISYIAALANLILLYAFCKRIMGKGFSITTVCIYSGMWLVNNLAVQGRGYTLSTTMLLMCMYCMLHIIQDDIVERKYYIFWAVGLCYGLYTVTSSLYYVVPVCVCAGISLLIFKRYKELLSIVIYSLFAAVATAILYLIVWLAIGSNLLLKEDGLFPGKGHIYVIGNYPFIAAKRGIDYMLATPYIQSVPRQGYMKAFGNHFTTLFGQMYSATSIVLLSFYLAAIFASIMLVSRIVFYKDRKYKYLEASDEIIAIKKIDENILILSVFVLVMLLVTPLVVYIQCKLPYYRVFSFYGVSLSVAMSYLLFILFGRQKPILTYVFPVVFIAFTIAQLSSADYNSSYGLREESAYDLMTKCDLTQYETVALTDCNEQYMYKFVYDTENENTDVETSKAVVVEKSMLDKDAEYAWEFFYDYETLPHERLNSMNVVYENDFYLLYVED